MELNMSCQNLPQGNVELTEWHIGPEVNQRPFDSKRG
ncbi:hypothetical protein CCACVL1_30400 [Corchorus capsularis]|uniref:Uncharacterized protein n=1 Tax=Corchorus capsularis TaxID=210143 RepID=A0A1R3FXD0_COCAP|nr:hypothetical protein CCACVL1_30400 [Corchorus capsularis]